MTIEQLYLAFKQLQPAEIESLIGRAQAFLDGLRAQTAPAGPPKKRRGRPPGKRLAEVDPAA